MPVCALPCQFDSIAVIFGTQASTTARRCNRLHVLYRSALREIRAMPTPCPAKHYVPPRRPFMSACASESVLRIRQAILRREKLSAAQRRRGLQSLKLVRIALPFSMPDSSAERTPSAVDDSVSHCCPSMAFGALPFVMRGDTDIGVSQTTTATLRRRLMKTFQAIGM